MVRRVLTSGAMVLACSGAAFAQDMVIGGNIGGFLVRNEESQVGRAWPRMMLDDVHC